MKKSFYIIFSLLIITSCTPELIPEVCIDNVCIDGEWIWEESYGSIAGMTITPETEMLTRKLIIDEDTYQEYVNDSLILDTPYEYLKTDEIASFSQDSLVIKLGTGDWLAVDRENDNLNLIEPCLDCWDHHYIKT